MSPREEEVRHAQKVIIAGLFDFGDGLAQPSQIQKAYHQVRETPRLTADAQVGLIIERLCLQFQQEPAPALVAPAFSRTGDRLAHPAGDRAALLRSGIVDEPHGRILAEPDAAGFDIEPADREEGTQDRLTRLPVFDASK